MSREFDETLEAHFETMPFLQRLGLGSATVSEGTARFVLPFDPANTNHNVLHGGVVATLVDATVAGAIHSDAEAGPDEMEALTIDMSVNYLGPVTEGDVTAEASLVSRGGTIAVGRSEVGVGDRLVATGTATYYQRWR